MDKSKIKQAKEKLKKKLKKSNNGKIIKK